MDRTNHDQAPAFDIVRRLHEQVISLANSTGAGGSDGATEGPLGVWDTLAETSRTVEEITGVDAGTRERAMGAVDTLNRAVRRADAVLSQIDAHDRPMAADHPGDTTNATVGTLSVLADVLAEKLDEIAAATIGRDDAPATARVLTGSDGSSEALTVR